jgi:hypothetical protein
MRETAPGLSPILYGLHNAKLKNLTVFCCNALVFFYSLGRQDAAVPCGSGFVHAESGAALRTRLKALEEIFA